MGPLAGIRVVEVESIGPGPFAGMVLADMGAEVLRVRRAGPGLLGPDVWDVVHRGKAAVTADLKREEGRELVLRLAGRADALLEGFRPGVLERLGLGPDVLHERNPRLVVGRVTGYGQDGPLSSVAGHDVNYLAISGVLSQFARRGERPLPPVNLLGDFGGGGLLLAFGVVCALLEARASGRGQVVDAAMVDGAALLGTFLHSLSAVGAWSEEAGTNVLDTGAHFYEVYETADGGHLAIGAIEPQFYAELLRLLELDPAEWPQWDRDRWPEMKERLAALLRTRTRDEWAALLEPAEACSTPVLGLREAAGHPHNRARATFVEHHGALQPAPAPRFDRTPADLGRPVPSGDELLAAWGVDGGSDTSAVAS